MNKAIISIFFVFLLTACTQAIEVPIVKKISATTTKATLVKTLKPTLTNPPKLTITDILPTSTPLTIDFEVTFDGNGCTVSGPAEVHIGNYSFLLNNTSGSKVKLVVGQLLDGHTFQDLVDLQTEPGDNFMIEPWMSQPFYYTKDHKIYIVSLDEAGEHNISISVYPHVGIWLCVPFQVIENPSE